MIRIDRCYDSHTHLLGTGQMLSMLQLKELADPADLPGLRVEPDFFRGDWLIGFGWDQHAFPGQAFPTRQQLDSVFPKTPVAFTRADGHAMWVNTEALRRCDLLRPVSEWKLPAGGETVMEASGFSTGILIDRAMEPVHAAIPPDGFAQKRSALAKGIRQFNRAGFTHLRDMSGEPEQWRALRDLEKNGELTLYVDQNFFFEKPEDFQNTLRLCREAREEGSKKIRARGVKFYLDGALGSEGAALTGNYGGTEGSGFLMWEAGQIKEWMSETWRAGFEVSIHALGDRSSLMVAKVARDLWTEGLEGRLNIEHAEVMAPETVALLRGGNVRVHVQPCHWLSDRKWLDRKLGDLAKRAFPWGALQEAGIPIQWGSDAPIERPSLFDNRQALEQSAREGIAPFLDDWWKPHRHLDTEWGSDCFTEIGEDRVLRVVFDGREI